MNGEKLLLLENAAKDLMVSLEAAASGCRGDEGRGSANSRKFRNTPYISAIKWSD